MKILWVSNAPYVGSGYGVQTQIFTRLLKTAGHDVTVFGFYGHQGAVMNAGGVPILPGGFDQWGNDVIPLHVEQYQPDVTVLLCDVWVYQPEVIKLMAAWAPIDHDPLPPLVAARLQDAGAAWAMSRFGERQMRSVGIIPQYVPHGVDRAVYRPVERTAARKAWGVPDEAFFAVMVAANKGFPSRKSIDKVLKAWGRFIEKHPDAVLYIHTLPGDQFGGIDVVHCANFYGVTQKNLRLPDVYRFMRGDYGGARLNDLYNAADVLLAPSMGEGFGVPVIDAQAAGCPVIVTDFSAQAELAGPGYKIPVDPFDDYEYTLQGSEMARVKPSAILTGLHWAVENRGNAKLRLDAFEFAEQYDAQTVLEKYMIPALESVASEKKETAAARERRTAARLLLRDDTVKMPKVEQKAVADAVAN